MKILCNTIIYISFIYNLQLFKFDLNYIRCLKIKNTAHVYLRKTLSTVRLWLSTVGDVAIITNTLYSFFVHTSYTVFKTCYLNWWTLFQSWLLDAQIYFLLLVQSGSLLHLIQSYDVKRFISNSTTKGEMFLIHNLYIHLYYL